MEVICFKQIGQVFKKNNNKKKNMSFLQFAEKVSPALGQLTYSFIFGCSK